MSTDSAINKIRKLLDLANEQSGGTDAERDLAMQRAQEIMLKHGLEMSMIEAATDDHSRDVGEERFEVLEEDWRRALLDAIARGSFARTYYYKGWGQTVIVGRPEQVAFVKELYHWLVPQLEGAAVKTAKSYDKRAQYAYLYGLRALTLEVAAGMIDLDPRDATQDDIAAAGLRRFLAASDGAYDIQHICGIALNYAKEVRPFVKRMQIAPGFAQHTGVFMRSFFMSASATVGQRLRDTQRKFANEGGDNAMALVKNETKAVNDFMESLNLSKESSQAQYDSAGWNAGADAARDFSLNLSKPVSGGRKELNA
jgi:Protein of unknown function (DUF2786)